MRKLVSVKTFSSNSLNEWHKIRNPFKVVFNFIVIFLSKFSPFLSLKRFLLRLTGMKIGKNVSIAPGVTFDFFWPELIELKENCLIGYNTTVLAHEFLIKEYRTGKVVIGKNVLIGANATVLAGTELGDDCIVGAMSLVNSDIPEKTFFAGVPAKFVKKI